jgi:hypothetical protein
MFTNWYWNEVPDIVTESGLKEVEIEDKEKIQDVLERLNKIEKKIGL